MNEIRALFQEFTNDEARKANQMVLEYVHKMVKENHVLYKHNHLLAKHLLHSKKAHEVCT